ncbi:hypothetical protein [Shewanella surugensis]|uniref:Uncharacterized protein n=1 Tax=Shewanella surugensis TaxID=212020 RepID=A0ABT0LIP3_9GAMM|nr:hypothetical protein [Shewanella surugensis]MCL1127568.1 hypothetical protein [Shewanella surugensis]
MSLNPFFTRMRWTHASITLYQYYVISLFLNQSDGYKAMNSYYASVAFDIPTSRFIQLIISALAFLMKFDGVGWQSGLTHRNAW